MLEFIVSTLLAVTLVAGGLGVVAFGLSSVFLFTMWITPGEEPVQSENVALCRKAWIFGATLLCIASLALVSSAVLFKY